MKHSTLIRLIGHVGCLLAAFGLGHYFPVLSRLYLLNFFPNFLFHTLAFGGALFALFAPWSRVQLGDNRAIDAQRLINVSLWLVGYYAGLGLLIARFGTPVGWR